MKRICAVALFLSLSLSCFAQGKTILLQFKYENISTETKYDAEGVVVEKIVKNFGQTDLNLQLRDRILERLNGDKYIMSIIPTDKYDIRILINPAIFVNPAFYSIAVEIQKSDGAFIARSLIRGFPVQAWDLVESATQKVANFVQDALE